MDQAMIQYQSSKGVAAYSSGDVGAAGKCFLSAYKLASKTAVDSSCMLTVYWNLAFFYRQQKRWSKAEKIYRAGIDWGHNCDPHHKKLPEFWHSLADVYIEKNQTRLAAIAYREALRFYEARSDVDQLSLVSQAYDSLVKLYCAREMFSQAEVFCKHAIAYVENVAPDAIQCIRKQHMRLAWLFVETSRLSEAESVWQRTLPS